MICPACKEPNCYQGFWSIECSSPYCRHYKATIFPGQKRRFRNAQIARSIFPDALTNYTDEELVIEYVGHTLVKFTVPRTYSDSCFVLEIKRMQEETVPA